MTDRRAPTLAVVASLAGLGSAVLVAAIVRFTAASTLEMIGLAVGGAAAAGGICLALLARMRTRALAMQVAVAALTPLLALVVGVLMGAGMMFRSEHDLRELLVFVLAAGTLGAVVGVGLGLRVKRIATDRARTVALEQSRRELVAWVSHDLRTPLAGLRAVIEALEDGVVADAESVERYQRAMRRDIERMTALVDDLFELSRIQIGALTLEPAATAIDELVAEAAAAFADVAAAEHIRLSVAVTGTPPQLELSRRELMRALANLIDNAIKHTGPGGEVRVEVDGDEGADNVVVSILDSCGGIPTADLDRVFEPAFRGDRARSRPGGGLGLAIAEGIIAAHDGSIEVANVGGGCCFSIVLPVPALARRS